MKAPDPQVSYPGLTRGSSLARTPSHKTRWMAGSSPAMTWGEAWDYCEARFALSGHDDRERHPILCFSSPLQFAHQRFRWMAEQFLHFRGAHLFDAFEVASMDA